MAAIKDLIKNKDYPLIQYRVTCPWSEKGEFCGVCKSQNGQLIPLDGDYYSEEEEVVSYEEWVHPQTGETCLEVLVEGEWVVE